MMSFYIDVCGFFFASDGARRDFCRARFFALCAHAQNSPALPPSRPGSSRRAHCAVFLASLAVCSLSLPAWLVASRALRSVLSLRRPSARLDHQKSKNFFLFFYHFSRCLGYLTVYYVLFNGFFLNFFKTFSSLFNNFFFLFSFQHFMF